MFLHSEKDASMTYIFKELITVFEEVNIKKEVFDIINDYYISFYEKDYDIKKIFDYLKYCQNCNELEGKFKLIKKDINLLLVETLIKSLKKKILMI